jgi:hypothetical protein
MLENTTVRPTMKTGQTRARSSIKDSLPGICSSVCSPGEKTHHSPRMSGCSERRLMTSTIHRMRQARATSFGRAAEGGSWMTDFGAW